MLDIITVPLSEIFARDKRIIELEFKLVTLQDKYNQMKRVELVRSEIKNYERLGGGG